MSNQGVHVHRRAQEKVSIGGPRRAALCALSLCLLLGGPAAAAAEAAPQLEWSAPLLIDQAQTPSAVSCPSAALCVAADRGGRVSATSNPAAAEPSWSQPQPIATHPLTGVSCPSAALCVAVDGAGDAWVSSQPAGPGPWQKESIDGITALTGVSCPSASLCVAVDGAGDAVTFAPLAPSQPAAVAHIDGTNALNAVSCAQATLCAAGDTSGAVLVSSDASTGAQASWRRTQIDPQGASLVGVSCIPSGLCVAVDTAGTALASNDAGDAAPAWSALAVDGSNAPRALSCAASGLCVAVDGGAQALMSDDAGALPPLWSTRSLGALSPLTAISCVTEGLCMALDSGGHALRGLVPVPVTATGAATAITASGGATLEGSVSPVDATVADCHFEYGTTTAYGSSVPCAQIPTPGSAPVAVAATLIGLAPGITYHFRLVAANVAGAGEGADAEFATPGIGLIHPNPSIVGVPAVKDRLHCLPGTPAGAQVTLAYEWLRDGKRISGVTGSQYTIRSQDARHHLQCRVTATNSAGSASASSAYVAVPAQGVLAAVGETEVGSALGRHGHVLVPLTCSPRAAGTCSLTVRVTVTETMRGRKVASVSARRAPRSRHVTVLVAEARLRLVRGASQTVSVGLNSTGRHLLARFRRLPVRVSVRGTIIGAISGSLGSQRLVVGR